MSTAAKHGHEAPRLKARRAQAADRALEAQRQLVERLRDPACYPHAVSRITLIETHISFVVLTGEIAYKIKKSVDLGFVDFTSLDKRRFFCGEELRLNSRLAPDIYLGVTPICGRRGAPRVGGEGEAIEYAVRMRQFPQDALADRAFRRGELTARHIDSLATLLAGFHSGLPPCSQADPYGSPETMWTFVAQNFAQLRELSAAAGQAAVDELASWSRQEHRRLSETLGQRKREGRVRECHGDLHLGNIVLLDGEPRVFDCIEFNPQLRWIDVMNEVAFPVMDLRAQGRPDLAARFLNAYLESTGDYSGVPLLRYYQVYRALVRAKVSLMRAPRLPAKHPPRARPQQRYREYLAVARDTARAPRPFIVIAHGFSGSGKTTLSQPLLELTGAIRVRSDVERKRLRGMAAGERGASGIGQGLYGPAAIRSTYDRLLALAQIIVAAGHGAIVDATFLQREQRDRFRDLAAQERVPFLIVDFTASEALLRERILSRQQQGQDVSDADLAVLDHQLRTQEPLQTDELESVLAYDASAAREQANDPLSWAGLLQRLSLPAD
jgi:aminoglycoside phosphotransferase family enzyme/predicted kinase